MSAAQTALVTGANRGIGLQVVVELVERGLHVVLGCRDPAAGHAALKDRGISDSQVTVLTMDVSDPGQNVEVAVR